MADLPTGTVTFLFTDLEGSTRRWEDDREAMRAAVARHDQLLDEWIANHGGVVFSRSCLVLLRRWPVYASASMVIRPSPSPSRTHPATPAGRLLTCRSLG